MGLFDDHGPTSNMLTNLALFRIPSSRPPGDVAEDFGRSLPVLALAAAVIGGGAYLAGAFDKKDDSLPPEHSAIDSSQLAVHFADYERLPRDGFTPEVRNLSKAYDELGRHRGFAFNEVQRAAGELDETIGKLLVSSEKHPELKEPVMRLAHAWFPVRDAQFPKLGAPEALVTGLREAVKDVLFAITEKGK
jgi:hypothetical protein